MTKDAVLIKIDRNGSKHYEGWETCDRCGGQGYYAIGVLNGRPVLSPLDSGVCWKCHGAKWVKAKWIERTPEYQAKLDARRNAKREAERAKWEAEEAERKAQREAEESKRKAEEAAEEARIEAEKKISQWVGTEAEQLVTKATYLCSPYFERKSFYGYGTETIYIHTFKDDAGNKIVWKTGKGLTLEEGDVVELKGLVKKHDEYKGEKQTLLIYTKVKKAG